MMMMRIRGVWTTNASAFLLGAGMYAALLTIPQFAQLPTRTGFGFGSSIVVSGLYLLPLTVMTMFVSMLAGPFAARLGSRWALIAGSTIMAAAFVVLAAAHSHPYDLLIGAGSAESDWDLASRRSETSSSVLCRLSRPASPPA